MCLRFSFSYQHLGTLDYLFLQFWNGSHFFCCFHQDAAASGLVLWLIFVWEPYSAWFRDHNGHIWWSTWLLLAVNAPSQLGETWIFLTRRKVEVWRALCASFGMQCIFHNCNHEFAPGVMSSGCSAAACAALAEVATTLLPFYGNQAGVMWGWECLVFVCKLRLGIHRIQQSNSASEWETAEA